MTPRTWKPALAGIVVLSCLLSHSAAAATTYRLLHSFGGPTDGSVPSGAPLLDEKGNIYGLTGGGGTGQCSGGGCGTAFELGPRSGGWEESIIHSFSGGSDGAFPEGRLALDAAGNLFGTVNGDIRPDVGGVFELVHASGGWTNNVLYTDISGPGVILGSRGNVYGSMASTQHEYGTVGELSLNSGIWTYTDLYSFCPERSCTNGFGDLPAPPVWDAEGNLFGTTTEGGLYLSGCYGGNGCGVVFEMTPNGNGTWAYHVVHSFGSYTDDGQTPYGGLVTDGAGNFYGTTEYGGAAGNGTVYKLAYANGGWKETIIYDFPDWHIGALPNTTLILDSAGNLYGASGGGVNTCSGYTCGVVFKLTPQATGGWKYSVLHRFSGPDGEFPWGVTVNSKGDIFGTTFAGGTYNAGVAFEIIP